MLLRHKPHLGSSLPHYNAELVGKPYPPGKMNDPMVDGLGVHLVTNDIANARCIIKTWR